MSYRTLLRARGDVRNQVLDLPHLIPRSAQNKLPALTVSCSSEFHKPHLYLPLSPLLFMTYSQALVI